MLKNTSIYNFKSIQKIETLELKPLTILTGVNSSGKSNILEALSFFAQASRFREVFPDRRPTMEAVFVDSEMKRYPIEIGKFIVFKGNANNSVTLEISTGLIDPLADYIGEKLETIKKAVIVFPKGITRIIQKSLLETVGYSISFKLSTPISYSQRILINGDTLIEINQILGETPARVIFPKGFEQTQVLSQLNEVFNTEVFRLQKADPQIDLFELTVLFDIARSILEYIKSIAEKIYFISGERGQINAEERIRDDQRGFPPSWIGFKGQHLMEILSRCHIRDPEKFRRIQEWGEKFQLSNIRAGYTERNILESQFLDDTIGVSLNSALAGLGSRQILSVITQIFWSEPDSLIMIEEPEISLHPKNQVLLHELFAEAISEGKQIICSTHSPFFILALSKIIKKKLLNLDDVAVYHIKKDSKGTCVEPMSLNKHGFIKKGVPNFMEVEEDLFKDWSETLEEK